MSSAYQFTGQLAFPPDRGVPPPLIPFAATVTFDDQNALIMSLSGSSTKTVDLSNFDAAGVKGLFIKVDTADPAPSPILIKYNGSNQGTELSGGGMAVIVNPTPVAGVTALTITHTSDVVVRLWVFG